MNPTRRNVIKAVATMPFILPSRIWAAETPPSDRLGVGFIGMGIQSRGLLKSFLYEDVQVLAVCDVDTTRREAARQKVDEHYAALPATGRPGCAAYDDFRELLDREDIDVVCIATPDHWHAIITLAALRAGKDVYCEKPLTHNIHEAIEVMKAVDANGRVLQTGSMQRSMKEFRVACELVRNGAIGKVERILCSFGDPAVPCDLPEEPMEFGLDWDMWLGPAPMRAYSSVLSPRGLHDHFPDWRLYREYGGGMVTDWGAHHLDIAQWGARHGRQRPGRGASAGAGRREARGHPGLRGRRDGDPRGRLRGGLPRLRGPRAGEPRHVHLHPRGGADRLVHRQGGRHLLRGRGGQGGEGVPGGREDPALRQHGPRRRLPGAGEGSPEAHHQRAGRWSHRHLLQPDEPGVLPPRPDPLGPAANAFAGGTGDPAWLTRDYRAPWSV